jgi:predicted metal-dependent HD superfamily phosphohydrolase
METELIKKARAFAEQTFSDKSFERRPFHNLSHTAEVVKAAEEIGKQSELNEDELESVIVAAWLHDVGYVEGAKDHELKAEQQARKLLTDWNIGQRKISDITDAIHSTRMPQQPRTLISKVLCDADLYHLASESCQEKADKLRKEWELTGEKIIPEGNWLTTNLEFMENHLYHTPYGKSVLQQGKKKNIKRVKKLLDPNHKEKKSKKLEEEIIKLRSKLEKERQLKPDRGIETMFRTTSQNHLMLSQMADNKANILITINSIILSVVVSVLVRKLEENPNLVVPTILLIAVCLSTTVFAILSTRPNLTAGRFTRDDIKGKRTNLLFFGNFHAMDVQEYEWSMKEMMKDADYLYGSLIKDIYYLGTVLGKKYKFLRIAYNIFMFGYVVAIISFIIAFMMNPVHG